MSVFMSVERDGEYVPLKWSDMMWNAVIAACEHFGHNIRSEARVVLPDDYTYRLASGEVGVEFHKGDVLNMWRCG